MTSKEANHQFDIMDFVPGPLMTPQQYDARTAVLRLRGHYIVSVELVCSHIKCEDCHQPGHLVTVDWSEPGVWCFNVCLECFAVRREIPVYREVASHKVR